MWIYWFFLDQFPLVFVDDLGFFDRKRFVLPKELNSLDDWKVGRRGMLFRQNEWGEIS